MASLGLAAIATGLVSITELHMLWVVVLTVVGVGGVVWVHHEGWVWHWWVVHWHAMVVWSVWGIWGDHWVVWVLWGLSVGVMVSILLTVWLLICAILISLHAYLVSSGWNNLSLIKVVLVTLNLHLSDLR